MYFSHFFLKNSTFIFAINFDNYSFIVFVIFPLFHELIHFGILKYDEGRSSFHHRLLVCQQDDWKNYPNDLHETVWRRVERGPGKKPLNQRGPTL